MFYCFVVQKGHRDYLRHLWYEDNNINKKVVEDRIKVYVFGNSPTSAITIYCMRQATKGKRSKVPMVHKAVCRETALCRWWSRRSRYIRRSCWSSHTNQRNVCRIQPASAEGSIEQTAGDGRLSNGRSCQRPERPGTRSGPIPSSEEPRTLLEHRNW